MESIEIIVRPYDSKVDDAYIYSTWTRYAWYSAKEKHDIPKRQFFKEKSAEIGFMLQAGFCRVACFKKERFVIVGYIAVYGGQIQWVCVKKDYAQEGIDQLLIQSMKGHYDETRTDHYRYAPGPQKDSGSRDSRLEG